MLNKVAVKLSNRLLSRKVISEECFDIYVYGFELLISSLLSTTFILLIGVISKSLIITISFLMTFISLRSFSGGYHAKTYTMCFIATIVTYIAVLVFSNLVQVSLFWYTVLMVLGVAILIKFSPVENINKRITLEQKKRFKLISIILFGAFIAVGMLLISVLAQVSSAIFFTLVSDLILLFVKNKKERR